jgi:hypothetical protein
MITVALRFADNKAPTDGTIAEHAKLIEKRGYVWYGKYGTPLSNSIVATILGEENPKILLIRSGKFERYWAYVSEISREAPAEDGFPAYYKDLKTKIHAWFKIVKIVSAPNNIMSKCFVASSNRPLSEASKSSMSPYFIIRINE